MVGSEVDLRGPPGCVHVLRLGHLHKRVVTTVGDRSDDVGVREHELSQGERLGLGHLIRTCISGKLRIAMGKVAVEIDLTAPIFSDAPVAVGVDSFGEHGIGRKLAFREIGRLEQSRVGRVDNERRHVRWLRILHAHLHDETIAIEILRRIFVGGAVAIVVDRTRGADLNSRACEC